MTISDHSRKAAADLAIRTGQASERDRDAIMAGKWDADNGDWPYIDAFAAFEAQIVEQLCAKLDHLTAPDEWSGSWASAMVIAMAAIRGADHVRD